MVVLTTAVAVLIVGLLVVALHLATVSIELRRGGRGLAGTALVWLVVGGGVAVWRGLDLVLPAIDSGALLLKTGALSLYVTVMIVYIEARSLLSRGYSLRILIDLAHRQGAPTVATAKSEYGQGLGIEGLIAKRISTLSAAGLLRFDGAVVGPITRLGTICARIGRGSRRLLSVGEVG